MQLTLKQSQLKIQMDWYEQLWAFTLHNPIEIPVDHIVRATTAEPQSSWTGIRAPGTHIPGVIKAGTYYTRRGKEFWYAIADATFLTIELRDQPYQKIVLTLVGNEDWADRLNSIKIRDAS